MYVCMYVCMYKLDLILKITIKNWYAIKQNNHTKPHHFNCFPIQDILIAIEFNLFEDTFVNSMVL